MQRNPNFQTLNPKQTPNPKFQRAEGFWPGIWDLEFGHCLEIRTLDLEFLLILCVSVPLWQ
jgi:hypothetical protein